MLQYHGGSSEKLQLLILAPAGVSSIDVNGATVHSALGLQSHVKVFPLDSNTLCAFRNNYAKGELVLLDGISMVPKKVLYQMHCRLIENFNLPNLPFVKSLAMS